MLTIERLERWRMEKPSDRAYKVKVEPQRYRGGHRDGLPIRVWLWDYEISFGVDIYSDAELDGLDLDKLKMAENMKELARLQDELKGVV